MKANHLLGTDARADFRARLSATTSKPDPLKVSSPEAIEQLETAADIAFTHAEAADLSRKAEQAKWRAGNPT